MAYAFCSSTRRSRIWQAALPLPDHVNSVLEEIDATFVDSVRGVVYARGIDADNGALARWLGADSENASGKDCTTGLASHV